MQSNRPHGRVAPAVAIVAAALAIHATGLMLAPRYGYFPDHDDQVRWGVQCTDEGMLALYHHPPPRQPARVWRSGKWRTVERTLDRVFVYPPAMAYLVCTSGHMHAALSDDRVVNTLTSRLCFSLWGIAANVLLAVGGAVLVARLDRSRSGLWAFAILLLAPPIVWDAVGWSQTDTVIAAIAVWMLVAMVAGRWLTAGALLGLAAALKPHAVLLLPIWALALAAKKPRAPRAAGLALAVAILALLALPVALNSGWTWFRISYVDNLLAAFPATTLKAFNVWYADYLVTGNLDARADWLGLSKDVWGRAALLIALTLGFAAAVRRGNGRPAGLLLWATVSLLLFVMLPTRVHERYIVLALPFVILSATVWPPVRVGAVLILIVATAQLGWPLWLHETRSGWIATAETVLTGLAIAGTVMTLCGSYRARTPNRLMNETNHARQTVPRRGAKGEEG